MIGKTIKVSKGPEKFAYIDVDGVEKAARFDGACWIGVVQEKPEYVMCFDGFNNEKINTPKHLLSDDWLLVRKAESNTLVWVNVDSYQISEV